MVLSATLVSDRSDAVAEKLKGHCSEWHADGIF